MPRAGFNGGGGGGSVAVGSITGLGTGVATALGVNVGSAGAPVVLGGALGTPSSGVLTNLTGSPTLTAPALGTPASGVLDSCTGSPILTPKVAGVNGSNFWQLKEIHDTISVGSGVSTADGAAGWLIAGAFLVGLRVEVLVQPGNTTTMGIGTTATANLYIPTGSSTAVGVLAGGPAAGAGSISSVFSAAARTVRITFGQTTNDALGSIKLSAVVLVPTYA